MAKTTKERSAKAAKKREQYDEKELRHRVRLGTRNMLEDLMTWTEDSEQASVMDGCIRHLHSLGRDGAIEALKTRHEITISKSLRDKFDNESRREAGHHSDDGEYEVIEPNRLPHGPDECAKAQLDILSQE
jgi:hypothetical protein